MQRSFIGLIALGLVMATLALVLAHRSGPDPKDLSAWVARGRSADWSEKAGSGDAEAQFLVGLSLVQTNLIKMVGRVPRLSGIPVIGKRFFEQISYGIDNSISQAQLSQAHQWIKRSADQGYAPAKYARQLFVGRIPEEQPPVKADRSP